MLKALASGRMLGGLALAVAFAVACVFLGRWQWGRYEDRQVVAAAVAAHYTAPAVPLGTVTSRLPLRPQDEWLRVTASGRYASDEQLLVRNRSLDGSTGFEVLAPLDLGGELAGRVLFVDRGWVASGASAAQLPQVPPAPAGDVTVEGWLRPGEPDLGRDLPAGQLASIDIAAASAQAGGGRPVDAYLVLRSERTADGRTPERPAPLGEPDTSLGPHQAYAIQWWLTSAFGFVLLGYRVRVAAAGSAVTEPVAPQPKKVRIWDEEDA